MWRRGQLLPIKFNENSSIGSKVISGGHTDTHRQAGDLISPLSFLESRLKMTHLKYIFENQRQDRKICNYGTTTEQLRKRVLQVLDRYMESYFEHTEKLF
jgi:hypothetical protein